MKNHKDEVRYNPQEIESKWQSKWEKDGIYRIDLDKAKNPYYCLMMFPYPSAEGLHVGSMYTFSGVDTYARFKRMQGYDVFEPIGLDGFGIHSENYALKTGRHPIEQSRISEENYYRQLHEIGNSFDWSRTVETYKTGYYKWTQWLFLTLFKKGLAYRKLSAVNFCPSCKTVLADEQVEDGKCERCGSLIEKRDLAQWFFRITDYAERLLNNLEDLDWSKKVKVAQKNWIGKSKGARIDFKVDLPSGKAGNSELRIEIFTTRPDTLYGVTFLVLSPDHPILDSLMMENKKEIEDYLQKAKNKSETERKEEKEKTGVFTGAYALNPINNERLPIWIADYVVMGYGTGAIMAVPAHDERDFEFAKKYNLEIKQVVSSGEQENKDEVYTGKGRLINSGDWNGKNVPDEIEEITNDLEKAKSGRKKSTFHLRDWLISRQRYWGPPIPMIYCKACSEAKKSWFTVNKKEDLASDWEHFGWYPEGEVNLPVELPFVEEFKPLGTGVSPLASVGSFYKVNCPECDGDARRETDVSDTFLDSSWYFLRYISSEFEDKAFDKNRVKKWLPVTVYIGGAEHAVLHLLYARFMTMALKDIGFLDFEEPFTKFYAHGLILKDGSKMSKSKGNVIVPDEYIKKYGADTLRVYLRFIGPFSDGGDFSDSGIEGMFKFLKRVWTLFAAKKITSIGEDSAAKEKMNTAIKGVTGDLEELRYNTAVAKLMTWYNFLSSKEEITKAETENFLKLFAPFAPHMTEEIWHRLGNSGSIHISKWPFFDSAFVDNEDLTIAVQIDGKLRSILVIGRNDIGNEESVTTKARKIEKVEKALAGQSVKRVIYIKGKVVNFVLQSN